MTVLTDPVEIRQTQEYLDDFNMLVPVIVNSVALEQEVDLQSPFVLAMASLLAQSRYYINHIVDIKDIDITPELDLLRKEVGLGLPFSSSFPLLQFLRENKRWYGHKGVEVIYKFIGALVGAPIKLRYPKDLLFRVSNLRSAISGAVTEHGGVLPWEQSKQARIRDGIFWSQYVYVLDVDQAQNFTNLQDLIGLLNSVHPAGMREFIELNYKFIVSSEFPDVRALFNYEAIDYYIVRLTWPTISNDLKTNTGGSLTSMHNGTLFGSGVWILENPVLLISSAFQTLVSSTSFIVAHSDPNNSNVVFSRLIGQPQGDYKRVYGHNDSLVFQHVRTNSGLGIYTVDVVGLLSLDELGLVALDNELRNPRLDWMYDQILSRSFVPQVQFGDQSTALDDGSATVTNSPSIDSIYAVILNSSWFSTNHVENPTNDDFDVIFSTPSTGGDFDYLVLQDGDLRIKIINVPQGVTELVVDVPWWSDPAAQLMVTPGWSTCIYWTDYSGGQVTLSLQTPAPTGAKLYCVFIDPPESGQVEGDGVDFNVDDISVTIPVTVSSPYRPFALPNWNTQIQIVKSPTDFVVSFTVPAPVGAKISWAVYEG